MNSSVSQLRPESAHEGDADSVASPQVAISPELIMLSAPSTVAAESIRQLRTRLIAQHVHQGGRALAVCAAAPGSGCSFVAANLAIAFAQAGSRVLLVNADMREPGLDEMFGEFAVGDGLAQYLTSNAPKADQVVETEVVDNLWFTPSGGAAADAQELLSNSRFASFVNIAVRQFDLVLIDSPPARHYADAQRIAAVAGYAIIVARRNLTYTRDLGTLSRQLAADRISVIGTVLNDY